MHGLITMMDLKDPAVKLSLLASWRTRLWKTASRRASCENDNVLNPSSTNYINLRGLVRVQTRVYKQSQLFPCTSAIICSHVVFGANTPNTCNEESLRSFLFVLLRNHRGYRHSHQLSVVWSCVQLHSPPLLHFRLNSTYAFRIDPWIPSSIFGSSLPYTIRVATKTKPGGTKQD